MKIYAVENNELAVLFKDEKLLVFNQAAELLPELSTVPASISSLVGEGGKSLSLIELTLKKIHDDEALQKKLTACRALIPLVEAKLNAPLSGPRTLVAVGMNYVDHLEEMDTEPPESPHVFTKSSAAIIGPDGHVKLPKGHENMVDWEAELAVVIGKTCYSVEPDNALDYVFGYTCANDLSARDWVQQTFDSKTHMDAINNWCINLLGKQFPTFCPLGPCLVTKSEIEDPGALRIECRVNNQVVQSSHTSKMLFSVPRVISYVSKFYSLNPGDIILTGTMAGVGYGRNPKIFLKSGENVEVEIEKIGVLKNLVIS